MRMSSNRNATRRPGGASWTRRRSDGDVEGSRGNRSDGIGERAKGDPEILDIRYGVGDLRRSLAKLEEDDACEYERARGIRLDGVGERSRRSDGVGERSGNRLDGVGELTKISVSGECAARDPAYAAI